MQLVHIREGGNPRDRRHAFFATDLRNHGNG
jgi:hypothetical protein